MRKRMTAVALLAICVATIGYAQDGKKAPRRKSSEQLRDLANPGPEHREMANYEGKWNLEIRLGAGESTVVYSGTSQNHMVAAGRFLLCEFDASLQNEVAAGVLTIGFDRRHGAYTNPSLDSWGTYFVTARGIRSQNSKLIKLYGKDDDPHMKSIGLKKEFAFELDLTSSHKFSIKVYMIDNRTENRREMLMMEYQFIKTE